jgi:hypothetical protein
VIDHLMTERTFYLATELTLYNHSRSRSLQRFSKGAETRAHIRIYTTHSPPGSAFQRGASGPTEITLRSDNSLHRALPADVVSAEGKCGAANLFVAQERIHDRERGALWGETAAPCALAIRRLEARARAGRWPCRGDRPPSTTGE